MFKLFCSSTRCRYGLSSVYVVWGRLPGSRDVPGKVCNCGGVVYVSALYAFSHDFTFFPTKSDVMLEEFLKEFHTLQNMHQF
jgi:hypothetical protein